MTEEQKNKVLKEISKPLKSQTFQVGHVYIQRFDDGIKHWTVAHRTEKTVTVTGEKWLGEVYKKHIKMDKSGVEFITFQKRYKGKLTAEKGGSNG